MYRIIETVYNEEKDIYFTKVIRDKIKDIEQAENICFELRCQGLSCQLIKTNEQNKKIILSWYRKEK